MEQTHNRSLITALILVAFCAGSFLFFHFKEEAKLERIALEERQFISSIREELDTLNFSAKAVAVYDLKREIELYGRNENVPLPIASLAKTMTLLAILPDLENDEVLSLSKLAISQNGDFGLYAMEKWKVKDLAEYTFIVSANDGAYALAEYWQNKIKESVGSEIDLVYKMNEKAQKLGMKNTIFFNTTGLDFEENSELKAGAFASASDINIMSIYAHKAFPDIFESSSVSSKLFKSESSFGHLAKNTNLLIPQRSFLFSKTGNTKVAGGSLAVIFKTDQESVFAINVLGSTINGRFEDMDKILNVLNKY